MGFNPGPMTLEGSNTYLVGTGEDRVLIDSGEGKPEYARALKEAVATETECLGRAVRVTQVVLTHWHPDHIGGVDTVRHLFPQARLLKQPSLYVTVPSLEALHPSLPPSVITVEGATLQVIHTPGHTDDHLCVFFEEERAMFTSDLVLGSGSSVFACYADYVASLEKVLTFNPRILYPAHGPVVADGVGRVHGIVAHREERERQILELLQEAAIRSKAEVAANATNQESPSAGSLTINDMVKVMYASTPRHLWPAAGSNVFHHLKKLLHEGRVVVVQYPPGLPEDRLSEASDYTMLGEGSRGENEAEMNQWFTQLRVALTRISPKE